MKAVVWDCDGVLVDSEPHSATSWMEVLADYGSKATVTDVAACTGLGYRSTYAHLTAIPSQRPIPGPDDLWPALLAALDRSFAAGLEVFPDARNALGHLAGLGVRQGCASTSPRSRLDLTLEAGGLAGFFHASAAGDEVEEGKPAPDVYLLAARRLGADPRRCVAVEDTGIGARSASAAGMRVVGVARLPGERAALQEAGAAVADRVELGRLLEMLGG